MNPKNYSIVVFLFFCLLVGVSVYGQENEFDKKYTPSENSIFNAAKVSAKEQVATSDVNIQNVIRFYPTALIRQKIIFSYDRQLTKGMALAIGIGKAFGPDFMQGLYFETFSSIETDENSLTPATIINNSIYQGSGLYLAGTLKIYMSGSTFDEGHIEFGYRHENTHYTMNESVNSYSYTSSNKEATFFMNAFTFGYGYSWVGGVSDNLVQEISFNMGIKLFKYTEIKRIESPPGSYNYSYQGTNNLLEARILPSFNFSYAFGFGF